MRCIQVPVLLDSHYNWGWAINILTLTDRDLRTALLRELNMHFRHKNCENSKFSCYFMPKMTAHFHHAEILNGRNNQVCLEMSKGFFSRSYGTTLLPKKTNISKMMAKLQFATGHEKSIKPLQCATKTKTNCHELEAIKWQIRTNTWSLLLVLCTAKYQACKNPLPTRSLVNVLRSKNIPV